GGDCCVDWATDAAASASTRASALSVRFIFMFFKPPNLHSKSVIQNSSLKIQNYSSCAATEKNRLDRLEENCRIEREALILDVVKIVLQLLSRILNRSAIRILDLCPAGESRRDQMSLLVVGNLCGELSNEVRAFWTWADE